MEKLEKKATEWEKHRVLILNTPLPGAKPLEKFYSKLKTTLINIIPAKYYFNKMIQARSCGCLYNF